MNKEFEKETGILFGNPYWIIKGKLIGVKVFDVTSEPFREYYLHILIGDDLKIEIIKKT